MKRPTPGGLRDGEQVVPQGGGGALDRFLRATNPGASWNAVRRAITTGKVSVNGARVTQATAPVGAGDTVVVRLAAPRTERAAVLPKQAVVHLDRHLVVVSKPAGVSTVPYDEHERGTLSELVRQALREREGRPGPPLGVVHRLDKETSGLLVFARTLPAKRHLKQQFRFHTAKRRYLAIVHGQLGDRTLSSRLVDDRGDGLRGSTDNPKLGKVAVTHVRCLRRLAGATLIECRLETGRTHQIRIHLAEAGHPVVGDRVYTRGHAGPVLPAPRVMLHAAELGFVHPASGQPMLFSVDPPDDFEQVLLSLQARA